MLRVELLGPLVVTDGAGTELTPQGQRERACLATLAVLAPEALSTERLAAELYRDRPTTDPRNAVQAVISRLRRALGRSAGSIETTGSGYRMVDVDLDIDRAAEALRAAAAAADPATAHRLLGEATARWRGPTLDGLRGDVLDAERVRIDGLRSDAEDAVLALLVEGGDGGGELDDAGPGAIGPHDVLERLERAVGDDPLRERRWELLMLALYRAGRQADALRAFQRARTLLGDRLGLEPGPALTDLEARILAQDPALAVSGADTVPSGARRRGDDPTLPSGTVTVLMCDVERSVERWERDPAEAAASIAGLHEIWSAAVADHGGHVVKSTGDGVLAAFSTGRAAIEAAAAAMRSQAETDLVVAAALATGSLQPIDGDYRGPTVNRCARLLQVANGGQILATAATAELAAGELSADVTIRDLGLHWLRDVAQPVSVVQIGGPGLRAEFGPLDSRGPDSLPRPRSELIGRRALVDDVIAQVEERPLVTLLGPGGIGKTSLALTAAWEIIGRRPVTFVDLARMTDPSEVAFQIAEQLVPTDDRDSAPPGARIAERLATTTDLVVIDNAEHVLDPVATLIDEVLAHDLKASFLITSRQPLGLVDEHLVALPPLALPADDADLVTTSLTPAIALFVERARASRPGFEIAGGQLPVVAHICRRLDGIPLAIELAASRAAMLSIEDIAARLDDQLRLLRQTRSGRERRHRSLEAVVGWSVDQLSRPARELFARLSVMAGSFGLHAVEELLAECELAWIDGLEDLGELCDASLVAVERGGSRYRMLEPIRQVAAAELADRGLVIETRRAHARWVTRLLSRAHDLRDEGRTVAMLAVDAEADQVRAAAAFVGDEAQRDLIPDLAYASSWWFLTRDTQSGSRLLSRLRPLIAVEEDPLGWALSTMGVAIASVTHPESDLAADSLAALDIFDRHDHPDAGMVRVVVAFCQGDGPGPELSERLMAEADRMVSSDDRYATAVVDLGVMVLTSLLLTVVGDGDGDSEGGHDIDVDVDVDVDLAIARGERAIAEFRALDERWALAVALGEIGRIHNHLGDHRLAESRFLASIDLLADADYHGAHYIYTELGAMASARGDHRRAIAYHQQSLDAAEAYGHRGCVAMSLAGMAGAKEAAGEPDEAIGLYRRALLLMREVSHVGWQRWQGEVQRLEQRRSEVAGAGSSGAVGRVGSTSDREDGGHDR